MRPIMIAGNWKMNTTVDEGAALVREIMGKCTPSSAVQVVFCPPATHLETLHGMLQGTFFELGAQNISQYAKGAYTGEIALDMVTPYVRYVIVGHSERREYFGETGELVNLKARAVIDQGLVPIICIGEKMEIREQGDYLSYILDQVTRALAGFDFTRAFILAYEPVWAIGTGLAASRDQAVEVISAIREQLVKLSSPEVAGRTLILYGGSTTDENLSRYLESGDIDGALIGGASLKAGVFAEMVKIAQTLR